MTKVFVCAGMRLATNKKINEEARLLGKLLAQKNDIMYLQGGSDQGLMGETLKEFLKYSNNVKFLIPNTYFKSDTPALRKIVGEDLFNVQETVGEAGRLTEIIKCDRIIVMPGGTGTFEELLYSNETKRSGEHKCRVTLVNIDGYFSGLLSQIEAGIREGLITNNVIHFDIVSSVKQIEF